MYSNTQLISDFQNVRVSYTGLLSGLLNWHHLGYKKSGLFWEIPSYGTRFEVCKFMTRLHTGTNWKQADTLAQTKSMLPWDIIWPFWQIDWPILGSGLIDTVLKPDLQLLYTLDIGNVLMVSRHRCLFVIKRLLLLHHKLKFSWHNQQLFVFCPEPLMLHMCSISVIFRNGNTCTHPVHGQKSGNFWKCSEIQRIGWELEMPKSSSIFNSVW